MKNELSKVNNQQVSVIGEQIIDSLRKSWGKVTYKRKVTQVDKEGKMTFVEKDFVGDSMIKSLNSDVPASVFYRFANLVKPEDEEHIQGLIKKGNFEVVKALQVFETAPMIIMDKKVRPASWDQAKALNSPSFATMKKYKGEEKTVDAVFLMLMQFAKKFGRRNDLTEQDLRDLAEDITIEHHNFSIADFKMILADVLKVSKNKYNLDYQGMMAVMSEFAEDRMKNASERLMREHRQANPIQHRVRKNEGLKVEGLDKKEMMSEFELQNRVDMVQKNINEHNKAKDQENRK